MRQQNMYGFRHAVLHLNIISVCKYVKVAGHTCLENLTTRFICKKKKKQNRCSILLGRKLSYDNDLTPSLVKIILNQAFKSCLVERQHP